MKTDSRPLAKSYLQQFRCLASFRMHPLRFKLYLFPRVGYGMLFADVAHSI
jgi:hypothetical protein